jgi:hypothetical protein
MESGVAIASTLVKFSIDTESRHQELLDLISSQSGSIDNASSVGGIPGFRSCFLDVFLDWKNFIEHQVNNVAPYFIGTHAV